MHYLEDLSALLLKVRDALRAEGALAFSVEHPMCTAPSNPGFVSSPDGALAWPVDHYLVEGPRITNWLAPGVVKQHRTIGTYVNSLISTGFQIDAVVEWGPTASADRSRAGVGRRAPSSTVLACQRSPPVTTLTPVTEVRSRSSTSATTTSPESARQAMDLRCGQRDPAFPPTTV